MQNRTTTRVEWIFRSPAMSVADVVCRDECGEPLECVRVYGRLAGSARQVRAAVDAHRRGEKTEGVEVLT